MGNEVFEAVERFIHIKSTLDSNGTSEGESDWLYYCFTVHQHLNVYYKAFCLLKVVNVGYGWWWWWWWWSFRISKHMRTRDSNMMFANQTKREKKQVWILYFHYPSDALWLKNMKNWATACDLTSLNVFDIWWVRLVIPVDYQNAECLDAQ